MNLTHKQQCTYPKENITKPNSAMSEKKLIHCYLVELLEEYKIVLKKDWLNSRKLNKLTYGQLFTYQRIETIGLFSQIQKKFTKIQHTFIMKSSQQTRNAQEFP